MRKKQGKETSKRKKMNEKIKRIVTGNEKNQGNCNREWEKSRELY